MTLTDLITRVEQGSGSDRQLDAELCVALQWDSETQFNPHNFRHLSATPTACILADDDHGKGHLYHPAHLTSSLDAIMALFKARLEVAFVTVLDNGPEHDSECVVNVWMDELPCSFEARLPDIHRAFLSATLKAIAAKEG